jgi:uncharacterized protein (DUF302 family)
MSDYGISITLEADFDDAAARTRAALADQGFGVLTEIDVAATMKTKLDVDMQPHLILGACNPQLAHQAIGIDASIGLLLPCNVVVRTLDDAHILVEAMNPAVMVTATGNTALQPVADQARLRLTTALQAMAAAKPS